MRMTPTRWRESRTNAGSGEGVLGAMYSMELVGNKGDAGRTMFRIHNQSRLVVRAKVACNFRVYGDPIKYGPLYDGEELWLVFPGQTVFEIEQLVQMKGKTVATMMRESTPTNREHQLTMLLEIEFEDELGSKRPLPRRMHYFDFDRWLWIPHIAEPK
jgi:hypothetical protein